MGRTLVIMLGRESGEMVGRDDVTGRNQHSLVVRPLPCGQGDPSRFWRCLGEGLRLLCLHDEFCSRKSSCLFEDQGCTVGRPDTASTGAGSSMSCRTTGQVRHAGIESSSVSDCGVDG